MHRYCLIPFAVVAVLLLARPLMTRWREPVPRTLAEVATLVERRGLYWAAENSFGLEGNRLVISTLPITVERASNLHVNDPSYSRWHGTLIVDLRFLAMMCNYDPAWSVVWGDLFVYGDPELIEDLTGLHPET